MVHPSGPCFTFTSRRPTWWASEESEGLMRKRERGIKESSEEDELEDRLGGKLEYG